MDKFAVDFQRLVEEQEEMISLATGEGRLVYVNHAYASAHGLDPAALIGRSLFDFVPETERDEVTRRLQEVCKTGQTRVSRNEVVFSDGRRRWIEWRNQPMRMSQDQPALLHSSGRDVEARVVAEKRLLESEQRVRLMTENAQNMILHMSIDGMWLYASPSCRNVLGFEPEEMLAIKSRDAIHPEDAPRVMATWSIPGPITLVTRMRHKFGHYVWVELRGQGIDRGDQGQQRLVLARDITERMQAELKFKSIMDGVERGKVLVEFGMDGVITSANENYLQMFGVSREQILGRHHDTLIPADSHQERQFLAELWEGLRRGESYESEVRRIGKDGAVLWMRATYFPILGLERKPIRVVKIANDVTAAVVSRAQLKDSQTRLRAVFDNVGDGIIAISGDGIIDSINLAGARMFGYSADELLGKNISLLMLTSDAARHDDYIRSYVSTGSTKVVGKGRELVGRRKDGSTFPMDLSVNEMNIGGRRMFTGVVRDITERKQAEKAKSEFISNVSHELRTPLTSIKGSLGLLRAGAMGALPDTARGMLDIAAKNCERLVRLINDILDADKMSAETMEFLTAPLDLCALLPQSIEAIRGYAREHNNVRFVFKTEVGRAMIEADADRIMQVMANLLSNATKYSPPEGEIEISLTRRGAGFCVSVSDRGPGIDPAFHGKIFGKFARADSSDSRKREGTGLGLSIAKTIVEKHGGVIGFATELGAGTTFHFELPEFREPAATTPAKSENDGKPRGRILVCEDEPDIAALLKLTLETDGFEAEIVASADEAKTRLAVATFDAMTLDIGLPGQDGLSLFRELRETPITATLPIVIISGRARSALAEVGAGHGSPDGWLRKPVENDLLLSCVRDAVAATAPLATWILHVEDDPDIIDIVAATLGDQAKIVTARSLAEARQRLLRGDFDLALLDQLLPDGKVDALLPIVDRAGRSVPMIVFSEVDASPQLRDTARAVLPKHKTDGETLRAAISSIVGPPKTRKVPSRKKASSP